MILLWSYLIGLFALFVLCILAEALHPARQFSFMWFVGTFILATAWPVWVLVSLVISIEDALVKPKDNGQSEEDIPP